MLDVTFRRPINLLQDPDSDYVVNHVHPGYVDTDMTSHKVGKHFLNASFIIN